MAFSNGNSTPAVFAAINTKIGKFVVRRKVDGKVEKQEFTQLRDVRISRIQMKDDEYEGQAFRKIQMTLEGDERVIVDINAGTFAAARLVATLNKADLNKMLGLTVRVQPAGSTYKRKDGTMSQPLESDITSVSVFQSTYIQLDRDEMPPKTERVTVGKKVVIDSTAREEFVERIVAQISMKLGNLVDERPGSDLGHVPGRGGDDEPPWPTETPGSLADIDSDIPF
jgi:hypothetical protein